ncbi:MAG TPA: hypothetical protein VF530_12410 [Planctomycetota bacterium]
MPRRLLIASGIALVLVLGARWARVELAERAWTKRRAELAQLALPPETLRRPWEVRYEALAQRVAGAQRFDELLESPHRPQVAWGSGEPRALDEFETLWVAAARDEYAGLDSILRELRALPPEELAWHGEAVKLLFLREVVNFLCARAWLAVDAGGFAEAVQHHGDALRLAQATDAASLIGTMVRYAAQTIVLRSVRGALVRGVPAGELRATLAPVLATWAYDPARAERGLRGELTAFLEQVGEATPDDPLDALRQFRPIEEALALARAPLASTPWGRGEPGTGPTARDDGRLQHWDVGVRQLHAFHAAGNVALTALAVAAHRERHAAWPATLADVADLPREHALDPLTGAPLAYALTADGVRIGPAAWGERVESWDDVDASPFVWTLSESRP